MITDEPGQLGRPAGRAGRAWNLVALELLDLLVLRDPLGGGRGPSPLDLLDLIDLGLAEICDFGPRELKITSLRSWPAKLKRNV